MARSSSQKFIARNRAPRIQIEYDVELYGAEKKVQIPFVIGVLADLSGKQQEDTPLISIEERNFLEIDAENFDERLRAMKPYVSFRVPNMLIGEGELSIDVTFDSMDDFSPAAVAWKVDGLRELLKARTQLGNLLAYMDGKSGAEKLISNLIKNPSLLQELTSAPSATDKSATKTSTETTSTGKKHTMAEEETTKQNESEHGVQTIDSSDFSALMKKEFKPKSDRTQQAVENSVLTLAEHILRDASFVYPDAARTIEAVIADIDKKLTDQINHILHHPDYQQLESAWRGLHYLVNNTETDETLKIRVMNISKKELGRTLKKFKGTHWDQSPVFKKIYGQEYETTGGEPYGCLVGDYSFDHSPTDVGLLSEIAKIAAAAHAPFISAASPSVMQMDSWTELSNPTDLTKIFTAPEYDAWRSLRESEDSRYIGLAIPRILARLPYGAKTDPVEEFDFEESTVSADNSHYCWANAAYAMATNISRAFKLFGWCARIRGVESGGVVEGLPLHIFPTEDGGVNMKCPTEIAIGDRREAELSKLGFMPLIHRKNTDFAVFISAQSFQKPAEYSDPDATANANLAARLPYLFACCRFAQYIKCIVRDKIGSFKDRESMQQWLQNWLIQYVDVDPENSSETTKVSRPLAAAEIVIDEIEGEPCYYHSALYLRPHYQLLGLTITLRLMLKLPSVSAA
jgi:type VI secretion system protein ImpC